MPEPGQTLRTTFTLGLLLALEAIAGPPARAEDQAPAAEPPAAEQPATEPPAAEQLATEPPGAPTATPLVIVQEEAPPEEGDAPLFRGLFASGQVGLVMPLSGPLALHRALGAEATIAAGILLLEQLAGFAEVVAARHETGAGWTYTTVGAGLGVRGTLMPELALHPFGEAGLLVQLVSAGDQDGLLSDPLVTLGMTMTVGLELDLSRHFSLEVGVRPEFVFNRAAWPEGEEAPDHTFLVAPFAAGTFYL